MRQRPRTGSILAATKEAKRDERFRSGEDRSLDRFVQVGQAIGGGGERTIKGKREESRLLQRRFVFARRADLGESCARALGARLVSFSMNAFEKALLGSAATLKACTEVAPAAKGNGAGGARQDDNDNAHHR